MLQELKAFLLRGDVVALAVAVIIGGAFGKVISSLVDDIISPILGMITGNPDFSQVVIGNVMIGNFINAVINFILVGTALFFVIKAAGHKPEEVK
ncbi:MAG: large conductance mechanosensitive channel protein MscL [Saprospiraceae bacterium]|nr:large conductance mechanosensitive channel protein MscL [Saprospiraceae bacterium]MDW8229186.1 large conductance mechanosensitive channel protein MscL [Saprospiraceae bacterium]